MDNKVLDEAVEVALGFMPAFLTHSQAWPTGYVDGHNDAMQTVEEHMRSALLAGVKVLLGQARPAIMDVDSERVAIVDRHDDCPSHGFQNVWIVDAPSLGEGDGR